MRPGHGGFTLVGGKPTRLVSAYAPSDGSKSSDSMTKTLEPHLTKRQFCSLTRTAWALTPTGCPTLTFFFSKLCWVVFRVYYRLVVSCGPKEPRGAP